MARARCTQRRGINLVDKHLSALYIKPFNCPGDAPISLIAQLDRAVVHFSEISRDLYFFLSEGGIEIYLAALEGLHDPAPFEITDGTPEDSQIRLTPFQPLLQFLLNASQLRFVNG